MSALLTQNPPLGLAMVIGVLLVLASALARLPRAPATWRRLSQEVTCLRAKEFRSTGDVVDDLKAVRRAHRRPRQSLPVRPR